MPDEAPPVPPAEPIPAGDPPPAATVVANGRLREETLAAELEAEKAARREAEMRAAGLEDDYRRLIEMQTKPDPATSKSRWLDGSTFFHGAD